MGIEFVYFVFGVGFSLIVLIFLRMVKGFPVNVQEEPVFLRNGVSEPYFEDKKSFVGKVQRVANKFHSVSNSYNTYNNSFNTYNTSFGDVKIYNIPALEYEKGNEFLCSSGDNPAEYIDYEAKKEIVFEESMPVIRPLQKQFKRVMK
jgi:hypothetical protein